MVAFDRARMIGSIGWVVILTAFVAWEALGLLVGHGWPTLSRVTRDVTGSPVGRWVLFGAWLWLGWHFFIRGWRFFLRGPGAGAPPPSPRGSGREVLAEVLLLGITLGLTLTGLLRVGAREAATRRDPRRPVPFGGLLLRVLMVAASCYAVLVGVVGLFVLVAGSDPAHLLPAAAGGGALLAFAVVVPGFLVLSLLAPAPAASDRSGAILEALTEVLAEGDPHRLPAAVGASHREPDRLVGVQARQRLPPACPGRRWRCR